MRRRLLFGLLAVTLLALPPASASADDPDDDTFVYIVADGRDRFTVHISDGRGGGQRKLTNRLTLWRPAISPDGTRIAFSVPIGSPTLGRFGIAVANLDGTGYELLTKPKYADFSPTGPATEPSWHLSETTGRTSTLRPVAYSAP